MAEVTLDNITVEYSGGTALRDVSLSIPDGTVMGVVGPSGSGKSTLLRVVAGLVKPSSGHVRFDGSAMDYIQPMDRNIGMVFQDNALYPKRDVRGNVAFPLQVRGLERDEVNRRVEAEARVLEIERLLDRMPSALSAGHQQLVQAARALVREPEVFLMDEPLARLDAKLRTAVRRELMLLQRGYGVTMLYVTNDHVEAMAVADSIAVLEGGTLRQVGPALEVYDAPVDTFVAGFLGSPSMGMAAGSVVRDGAGFVVRIGNVRSLFWTPALGDAVGKAVTVGLRPEDVRIGEEATGGGTGIVVSIDDTGDVAWVTIRIGEDTTVVARVTGIRPTPGSSVSVGFEAIHVFDDTGRAIAHSARTLR